MKNALWGAIAVLAILFLTGARNQYDCGRYGMFTMECTREYFEFDQSFPGKTEKINHCFKIDKDTGEVWLFKDERHKMPNSIKIRVKQYFQKLPYEEVILPKN